MHIIHTNPIVFTEWGSFSFRTDVLGMFTKMSRFDGENKIHEDDIHCFSTEPDIDKDYETL